MAILQYTKLLTMVMIRVLDELGVDINAGVDWTPLHRAIVKGQIRVLVELGVDINTPDDNGITPMERAVEEGRVDLIRVLTELGADIRRVLFLYI